MKQPHEDITGIDRSDNDLLSLDERAVAHRDLVINLVGHLRTACMVGNPAPIVERMAKRLRSPQPGDLVVAYLADMRKPDNRLKGFGYLVERRREWWETDEEWARIKAEEGYEDDSERTTDDAWYVQYGPAPVDICRWTNCDFTMVPAQARESFDLLFGTRNGSGVTVNRDDVLGALADSGFSLRLPPPD
jgi:hypothetical protein